MQSCTRMSYQERNRHDDNVTGRRWVSGVTKPYGHPLSTTHDKLYGSATARLWRLRKFDKKATSCDFISMVIYGPRLSVFTILVITYKYFSFVQDFYSSVEYLFFFFNSSSASEWKHLNLLTRFQNYVCPVDFVLIPSLSEQFSLLKTIWTVFSIIGLRIVLIILPSHV